MLINSEKYNQKQLVESKCKTKDIKTLFKIFRYSFTFERVASGCTFYKLYI